VWENQNQYVDPKRVINALRDEFDGDRGGSWSGKLYSNLFKKGAFKFITRARIPMVAMVTQGKFREIFLKKKFPRKFSTQISQRVPGEFSGCSRKNGVKLMRRE
jgi:hypothetical protein